MTDVHSERGEADITLDKDQERAIIEAGEAAVAEVQSEGVERARATYSRQPRFRSDMDSLYGALIRWVKLAESLSVPDYSSNSRNRDEFLQVFWMREPHWAGVISQLKMINSGRGLVFKHLIDFSVKFFQIL